MRTIAIGMIGGRWVGPLVWRCLSTAVLAVVLLAAACSTTGDGPIGEVADADRTVTSVPSSADSGDGDSPGDDTAGKHNSDAEPSDTGSDENTDVTTDQNAEVPVAAASGLVWTAVAVGFDDVLNVRTGPDPDQPIVAELSPWATSLPVQGDDGGPEYRNEGAGTWILVADGQVGEGWVNRRFVVAQPVSLSDDDRDAMVDASQQLLNVLINSDSDFGADLDPILGQQGVWVGGFGVFADLPHPWQWLPAGDVNEADEWFVDRDFEFGPDLDFPCPECRRSLVDFVGLNHQDQPVEILINDVADAVSGGFYDGALFHAPSTLHRVVLHQPNTEYVADDGSTQPNLDWRRIHLIFDWSDGEPRIALINVHGWTP